MIETNLPQSEGDDAHDGSSGESAQVESPQMESQPAPGQLAAGQPTAGQPVEGQLAESSQAAGQQAANQPAEDQPAASQPVAGQPMEGSGGDAEDSQPDQSYIPPFSRKRLTRRQWKLAFTMMGASVLICFVVVASNLITVPYVSISPGSVYSLSEAVYISEGEGEFAIYPPESDMGFVTVRRSERLRLWRLFFDSLDSRVDIRRDDINRGLTDQELDRLRAFQMLGSQGDAVEIALRHLGRTRVTLLLDPQSDSLVDTVRCFLVDSEEEEVAESLQRLRQDFVPLMPDGSRAFNQTAGLRFLGGSENGALRETLEGYWKSLTGLFLGDTVVSANGEPVGDTADLRSALQGIQPGETVILEMQFFDQPVRQVAVRLAESLDGDLGVPVLTLEGLTVPGEAGEGSESEEGIVSETEQRCPDTQQWQFFDWPDWELAERVNFDTGDVGGPSAGLAFALAVVDMLTEGDLTGGLRVATTGIFNNSYSDDVSSVGGVRQKTAAVRNSGYDVFLVPENDYDEAISAAGDELRVEQVTTLRNALAVLECLGGDPVLLDAETPAAEPETADLAACS